MNGKALDDRAERAIDDFAETAREFCAWLESDPGDDASERFTGLMLLPRLYERALRLPAIPDEHLTTSWDDGSKVPPALDQQVMRRLDSFPYRGYWRIEHTEKDEVEKVQDDLAGDLYFAYSGLRASLTDFERGNGHRYRAVWSWRYTFWLDWGRHSTNAIQALHAQLHAEANGDE